MNLKKLFVLLAACVFATLALAGCGGSDSASSGSGSSAKVLKVGSSIDFAPFEFQDEGQKEYQGFDMDLIRAIGKEMGYEVEVQNIGFDGLIPALQAKNIDVIISGMTINDERKQNVSFSDPYYQSGLTMVVRSDEQAIKSFQDLKGHKVADRVRCIVIPGSPAIYKESMKRGYIDTFIDAGCAVSTPTCGPCLGGYMGIMAAGERCVSTTNRNFRGRMGHVDSEVYLAGPQVAAASAILGRIATPEEVK